MWNCTQCGLENIDDGVKRCPACACLRYPELHLSGSQGEIILRTNLRFGNKNLRTLVGDDAQYASETQFEIFIKDGEYFVSVDDNRRGNPTLLNGKPIAGEIKSLSDGDVICVGSHTNSDVHKGEIKISIN